VILRFLGLTLALAMTAVPLLGAVDLRPELVVIVYPLTATTGTNPEAGSNVAILFSTRMAESGGLTIKPPTPGTDRADYLAAARKQNADYYITGYLTPLGDDISMLAQVVSTFSGTVVFSTTTVVRRSRRSGRRPARCDLAARRARPSQRGPTAATQQHARARAQRRPARRHVGEHHQHFPPHEERKRSDSRALGDAGGRVGIASNGKSKRSNADAHSARRPIPRGAPCAFAFAGAGRSRTPCRRARPRCQRRGTER